MIQYKVINATHDEFHRMAGELIKEGWLPQGGVAIIREYLTTPTTYYFQAWIRTKV
jgi:hypothetical protein